MSYQSVSDAAIPIGPGEPVDLKAGPASPPRLLLHGIDTVQCAYFLRAAGRCHVNFDRLMVERERLRQSKDREPAVISLGRQEFHLAPRGSSLGFPLVISNADYQIEFGQYQNPSFFVTFRSQALWRDGEQALHRKFLDWVQPLGFEPYETEGLNRVDFSFDYHLPEVDFDEDCFVSLASKDSQHRQDGKVQTFTLGRSDVVLRVYDKVAEIKQQSGKVWLFDLWGRETEVWRIEWQIRKDVLRRFGIRTFQELHDQQGDLLRYLATEHDTLRRPTNDSNRSRWPLHPLWLDLQDKIRTLAALGVYRVDGKPAALRERRARLGIAVYGYLKQLAAVTAAQRGLADEPSLSDTEQELALLIAQLHDALSWRMDVAKRMKNIELGDW